MWQILVKKEVHKIVHIYKCLFKNYQALTLTHNILISSQKESPEKLRSIGLRRMYSAPVICPPNTGLGLGCFEGFPGSSVVKNLPAVQESQETWVWSQGQEDLLEEKMATHSSALAWRVPCTEDPGGLWSMGSERVGHDWVIKKQTYILS